MADTISLPAKLDLSALNALHAELITHQNKNLTLDLAAVTQLGTLCLQLMIATAKQARSEGNTVSLRNTSDRILEQMRVMGITPEMIMEGQP